MSFIPLPTEIASQYVSGGQQPSTGLLPVWNKYTVTYAQLSDVDVANDIELFSLAAKTCIQQVVVKPTIVFAGTTTYTISIGIAGSLVKYVAASNVMAAVSSTLYYTVGASFIPTIENFAAAASIRISAVCTVENLDDATQGSVDVYVLTSLLP